MMDTKTEPIEEFPPVPPQLLWMFDGIDRKEATKLMHDYAVSAITWKPSKALRLEDENKELKIALKIKTEEHDCCADAVVCSAFENTWKNAWWLGPVSSPQAPTFRKGLSWLAKSGRD